MVLLNWRAAFIIIGVVSLTWVFVWFWYFRDDPKEHPAITEAELAMLPRRDASTLAPLTEIFAREWIAGPLQIPGDRFLLERMLRAGVRFAMVDEIVYDYYPSSLWGRVGSVGRD